MDMLLTPRPHKPLAPSRRGLLAGFGAVGALALGGFALAPATPARAAAVRFGGETMGTTYTVKIAGRALTPARVEALRADVQSALDGVDHGMSLHRPTSELRRFNAQPAGTIALSADFHAVLSEACAVAAWSDGAFDPTVAPLVDAWGFGAERVSAAPSAAALALRRRSVGFGGLTLDPAQRAAVKARDALALDFGGVAKGFGVDAVARALAAQGFENFMVEAGGEVRAHGLNAEGRPWAIGVEQPDAWPQRARLVLPVSDAAVATSGDYRNVIEHDGRRYAHEIDPRTGAPIARGLASVTVVADNAMRADALATALIVMGPDEGRARAEGAGIAALFITRDAAGGLHDAPTAAFAALGARRAA